MSLEREHFFARRHVQTLAVLSQLPVTRRFPSEEKATARTCFVCPLDTISKRGLAALFALKNARFQAFEIVS